MMLKRINKTVPKVLGQVKAVRTLTLPSGKKVRMLRKDIFQRALERTKGERR